MVEPVTICVPAWRAAGFLAQTIDSALAQTWPAIRIAISVDQCDDATAAIAIEYAARHGVRVKVQPNRLGWVGNTNAALALADTRYAMNLPHDDILAPEYVARCMAALAANSDAVLAYSDLTYLDQRRMQASIRGDRDARISDYLRNHFIAIGMRGVFDRGRLADYALPDFAIGDFSADALWIGKLVCQGAIIRVAEDLYFKRALARAVHNQWKAAPRSELGEMWVTHVVELMRVVERFVPPSEWTPELATALDYRFMHPWQRDVAPDCIDASLPFMPQAVAVRERVAARTPPFSWMRERRKSRPG